MDLGVQENDNIKLYTLKELQNVMKIGKNTAYKLTKLKGFPIIRIGNKILVPHNQLIEWLDKNKGNTINI